MNAAVSPIASTENLNPDIVLMKFWVSEPKRGRRGNGMRRRNVRFLRLVNAGKVFGTNAATTWNA